MFLAQTIFPHVEPINKQSATPKERKHEIQSRIMHNPALHSAVLISILSKTGKLG